MQGHLRAPSGRWTHDREVSSSIPDGTISVLPCFRSFLRREIPCQLLGVGQKYLPFTNIAWHWFIYSLTILRTKGVGHGLHN